MCSRREARGDLSFSDFCDPFHSTSWRQVIRYCEDIEPNRDLWRLTSDQTRQEFVRPKEDRTVALTLVVAAASPGSPKFAVINFSNTPPTVVMTEASKMEASWTATGPWPQWPKIVAIRSRYSTSRRRHCPRRPDRWTRAFKLDRSRFTDPTCWVRIGCTSALERITDARKTSRQVGKCQEPALA